MTFDFKIKYKVGSSNRVADALSRENEGEMVLNEMLTTSIIDWEILFKEIEQDLFLKRLKQDVSNKKEQFTEFEMMNWRLLFKRRLVIPKNSSFIPRLLKEYHDSSVGSHSGELKTYMRMASDWFWQVCAKM